MPCGLDALDQIASPDLAGPPCPAAPLKWRGAFRVNGREPCFRVDEPMGAQRPALPWCPQQPCSKR